MSKESSSKGFSDEESGRVREALRAVWRSRYDENVSALARDLNLAQSSVHKFVKEGSTRLSPAMLDAAARLLSVPKMELLSGRQDIEIRVEKLERYPNLAEVLRMMASEFDPKTLERVRARFVGHRSETDRSHREWIKLLESAELMETFDDSTQHDEISEDVTEAADARGASDREVLRRR